MRQHEHKRILIVDDDESGRYLKSHIFRHAGYGVIESNCGEDALRQIEDEKPALVVLDVRLPDASGLKICREIKTRFPGTMVLQTSAAFTGKQDKAAGLVGGADSYLVEPIEPDELVATAQALLRLHDAERELRDARDLLERRVAERTEEISAINAQLKSEIEQRAEAEAILRHAQKLDTLGQLTGGIAHDFNNFLAIIIGNLESMSRQLQRGDLDRARLVGSLNNALGGAERATAVTKRLLAFARRQNLRPTPTDICRFFARLEPLLSQTLGERVAYQSDLSAPACVSRIDPAQLEVAIINLALNARDAMPDGGRFRLRVASLVLDQPRTHRVGVVEPGDYVTIEVADSGVGMDDEVLRYASEPFFTTKEIGHGTGLGLPQAYGFVKQSEGHLAIDSTPGRGTTITIYLPRVAGDQQPLADRQEESVEYAARPHGVLVVEDDQQLRALTLDLLIELGYRPYEATNGEDALRQLQARTDIELMLTDIGLPGPMDGTRLAEFVQRQDHKLKVLYATGYVLSGNQLPPDVPESQLLRKPYNLATLSRKLAAAFRGSSERRVLLVDDEALLRADLAMALGDLGFAVDEAGTAREAMTKAEERHYGFTAALIDLGLPDQRGDDLALGLRSADSRLPIILLTGYDSEVALQKFKGDALVAYVGKPYRLHELEAALRKFDLDVALDR